MTRSQHQFLAMTAALRVKACKGLQKKKAQSDCLNHLRASLAKPGATGESLYLKQA